jgi:quinol monooxygenase YgiN
MTFALAVTMTINEGQEEKALELLAEMNRLTRAEEGCIFLLPHRDLEDPSVVFIYEQWDDRAAHQRHLETEHFKTIAEGQLQPLVEWEVQELEPYEVPASQPVA